MSAADASVPQAPAAAAVTRREAWLVSLSAGLVKRAGERGRQAGACRVTPTTPTP
jgi:hypothetical protein